MQKRPRRPKHPVRPDPLPDVVCHPLGDGLELLVSTTETGREWFSDCPDFRVTALTCGRVFVNAEFVIALMRQDNLVVLRK